MSIIHKFLVIEAIENTVSKFPEGWNKLLKSTSNILKAELVVTIVRKGDENVVKNMFFGETSSSPTEINLKGFFNPYMVVTRRKALEMGFVIAKLIS